MIDVVHTKNITSSAQYLTECDYVLEELSTIFHLSCNTSRSGLQRSHMTDPES